MKKTTDNINWKSKRFIVAVSIFILWCVSLAIDPATFRFLTIPVLSFLAIWCGFDTYRSAGTDEIMKKLVDKIDN